MIVLIILIAILAGTTCYFAMKNYEANKAAGQIKRIEVAQEITLDEKSEMTKEEQATNAKKAAIGLILKEVRKAIRFTEDYNSESGVYSCKLMLDVRFDRDKYLADIAKSFK